MSRDRLSTVLRITSILSFLLALSFNILAGSTSVLAAPTDVGPTRTPTPSRTPSATAAGAATATPTPCQTPTTTKSPETVCPDSFPLLIGPTSYNGITMATEAKPSDVSCNGKLWVVWTGTDDHINVGWGSTGGAFQGVVTYDEQFHEEKTYTNSKTNPSTVTGPSAACWNNQVWIAWTGTDKQVNFGRYDGSQIMADKHVTGQDTNYTPAAALDTGSVLQVMWYGTGGHLATLQYNGVSIQYAPGAPAITATGGPGLAFFCPTSGFCGMYFAWINNLTITIGTFSGFFTQNPFQIHESLPFQAGGPQTDAELYVHSNGLYLPFVTLNLSEIGVARCTNLADPELASSWWMPNEPANPEATSGVGGADFNGTAYLTWEGWATADLYLSTY